MAKTKTRIEITNLNEEVIYKLDRLAAESNTNRSDYLRQLLTLHTQSKELTEQRFMYEELVERLTAALEVSNELFINVANELRDVKLELEGLRSV